MNGKKRRVSNLTDSILGDLDAVERLQQVVETDARGDRDEAVQIAQAAPTECYRLQDPHYDELMRTVLLLVHELENDIVDLHADLQRLQEVEAGIRAMVAVPGSSSAPPLQGGGEGDDPRQPDEVACGMLYHMACLPRLKQARASLRAFRDTCRKELALDPDKVMNAYLDEKKRRLLEEYLGHIESSPVDEDEKDAYEDALARYRFFIDLLFEKVEESKDE